MNLATTRRAPRSPKHSAVDDAVLTLARLADVDVPRAALLYAFAKVDLRSRWERISLGARA